MLLKTYGQHHISIPASIFSEYAEAVTANGSAGDGMLFVAFVDMPMTGRV
jgi:hypothetical protein